MQRNAPNSIMLGVVGLVVLVLAAAYAIADFAKSERERDMRNWQVRLSIVADSRLEAIGRWLDAQYGELSGLADSAALN